MNVFAGYGTKASVPPEFTTAAEPTLARIKSDREALDQSQRHHSKIHGMLQCLETSLFSSECNVSFLKKQAEVRDNSIVILFHSRVGFTPKQYLDDRRMEVARRLLANTRLPIWQISDLLGYSILGVFSKAFDRTMGMRPSVYRKYVRGIGEAFEGGGNPVPPKYLEQRFLKRVLHGDVPLEEGRELIRFLQEHYPEPGVSAAF